MSVAPGKITIPEVEARFRAYRQKNPSWGSLHVVLDDGNLRDDHVRFCIDAAETNGDTEGKALAELLLRMSRTQRRKLSRTPYDWVSWRTICAS